LNASGKRCSTYLDNDVAEAQKSLSPRHPEERDQSMEENEREADFAVAEESGDEPLEVRGARVLPEAQKAQRQVPDVVRNEREHQDEQGVQSHHPENMLQKCLKNKTRPGQLVRC